ncbi:hypothetical protein HC256_007597 [Beauveria bassiana]|nr:hypothetical protein HC256_007597 [Beauveria bassiana]
MTYICSGYYYTSDIVSTQSTCAIHDELKAVRTLLKNGTNSRLCIEQQTALKQAMKNDTSQYEKADSSSPSNPQRRGTAPWGKITQISISKSKVDTRPSLHVSAEVSDERVAAWLLIYGGDVHAMADENLTAVGVLRKKT